MVALFCCAGLPAQVAGEAAAPSDEYEQQLQDANRKLLRGEILAAEAKFEELF